MRRWLLAPALLLTSVAFAAGTMHIIEPWAKATSAQQVEVYLTLQNDGAEQDRLVGASSPQASSVQLLTTVQLGSVRSVQPLKSIGVPAGGQQVLAPAHTRIALGLKRALQADEALALTLQFEKAGQRQITVEVRP